MDPFLSPLFSPPVHSPPVPYPRPPVLPFVLPPSLPIVVGIPGIDEIICKRWNALFGHVVRLDTRTPAHQALNRVISTQNPVTVPTLTGVESRFLSPPRSLSHPLFSTRAPPSRLSFHPLPSLPSPTLRNRAHKIQPGHLRSAVNRIWFIFALKSDLWCQQFWWFSENQITEFYGEFPTFIHAANT